MQMRSVLIAIFSIIVIGVLGVGFYFVGSPDYNFKLNVDKQKRADLWKLKNRIENYGYENCALPKKLDDLEPRNYDRLKFELSDYTYKTLNKTDYELCADFSFDYNIEKNGEVDPDKLTYDSEYSYYEPYSGDFNKHKAGHYCFKNKFNNMNCTKKPKL